ncbi:glycosyltransferase [Caulobacter endophyticus]|uniref:glycosyltransferase n=1 Tax=Caulobacter endophyticus TaxID=2172652 RepID=UPI00240FF7BB|nr:glycosyltransferase [Caulobacter endophyticus]MDG2531568.1 glycosyltransferase [Caulobacter endophyticus]
MKIVIAALPAGGHVNPMLGIACFLAEQGHEICVYTGTTMRSRVTSLGLRFHPLPAPVDFDLSDINACFEGRANLSEHDQIALDFEKMFLGAIAEQDAGLQKLLLQWPAEVVLTEGLFYGALPMILRNHAPRPTVIQCGICPPPLVRPDFGPYGPGAPFTDSPEERMHYRDVVAPMVKDLLAPLQSIYDGVLADLNLGAANSDFLRANLRNADIFLQSGVPGFEYPTGPLPDNFRFIGLPPQPPAPVEIPAWAPDLDRYRRVVLVTQGTIANEDMRRLLSPTIAALGNDSDTLIVATGGGREVPGADQMPANVRVANYLPFDWILPRLDALVTNGGFGGVLQALAVGVPLVVAGTTEDKKEVSARVAWSGAGVSLNTDTPSDEDMANALSQVLGNKAFRKRALALSEEFKRYDARTSLIQALAEVRTRNASQFI